VQQQTPLVLLQIELHDDDFFVRTAWPEKYTVCFVKRLINLIKLIRNKISENVAELWKFACSAVCRPAAHSDITVV